MSCPPPYAVARRGASACMKATLRAGLIAALLVLGPAGCGMMPDRGLSTFASKSADVDFGMTKVQVQHIMGVPRNRLYSGSQEAWQWCETSNSPNQADLFLTAYFYNGRVAGVHTYFNRAEGTCDNFFRRVEWLTDPEKAMAAKERRRG